MKHFEWVLAAALSAAAGSAVAGDVTVKLSGVEARGGQLLVSLQARDQFMQPRADHGAKIDAPAAGIVEVTLHDVPAGDYALTVMHDANGDYQMARGPAGMPAEGWAMSGHPPADRMPTFDDVKFTVAADGGSVPARMVYP